MEIEVGMYVRTYNGEIAKLISLCDTGGFNTDIDEVISEKHFKKASHNIIELIEVGDYVNGIKVDHVMPPLKIWLDAEEYLEDEIKTIVTKEQFESCMYKVGE